MSLESTETSTEVPTEYGGILDPRVRSDDSGNVIDLPGPPYDEATALSHIEKEAHATEAPVDPRWRRSEALRQLIDLLPFTPVEYRSTDLAGLLADAEKIADWLEGK